MSGKIPPVDGDEQAGTTRPDDSVTPEPDPLPGAAPPGGAVTPPLDATVPTAVAAPAVAPEGRSAAGFLASTGRGLLVPVLSVLTALVLGAVVIILSDPQFVGQLGTDPIAAFRAGLDTVSRAYSALFTGALGSPSGYVDALASGDGSRILLSFRPLSETLLAATPLIFTGLAVALGFQCGLFNIGAEGQLYAGAVLATFVGFSVTGLPGIFHLGLALAAGFAGGALWGFIPGFLKARTGAHEVIVTIMLNYVAFRLVDYLLKSPLFQRPGRSDPISKEIAPSAALPSLIDGLRADWGFVLALAVAAVISWLLFRSTKGFEFRAVGLNPSAARYAGMSIGAATVLAMMISGGLAGLAGTVVVLGVTQSLTNGISPGYGFDGIALALIASSKPKGVVLAGLLFGALRAGATPMQSATGIPIDLVVIIQALVIMFVAAPALVRGIFRRPVSKTTGAEVFSKGWGS